MYYVEQSGSFEAIVEVGITGLVGTIEFQIQDNLGNTVSGPTTAGIIESPAGSGFYQISTTAPAIIGQYSLVWSDDGSFSENHTFVDDLTVVEAGAGDALPPISPIGPGPGAVPGPCNAWVTEEEVAACCDAGVESSELDQYTEVATSATRILWELSARQFSGACDRTVRPCRNGHTWCGMQVLSRGHVVAWNGGNWHSATTTTCGCQPLSRVKLSGYPVREIIEVKIDGAVVDAGSYRLDEWRWLTRKDGEWWPSCQDLSRDDTEDGTFSVRYTYGQNPPEVGQQAAAALACELYKACIGAECKLPSGAVRIVRQGLTIERLQPLASMLIRGETGIPSIDAFMAAYNPSRLRRRPSIWSPEGAKYARPVGS